jgi:transcriptional regulator with XRE-family HTH domain
MSFGKRLLEARKKKSISQEELADAKAQLLEEIKEAVGNLNLVKQGKLKARPAKDLLNEL